MIRVQDALPAQGHEVLVLHDAYGEWDIAQFWEWEGWVSTITGERPYPVSHWCELPERPSGK